MSEETEKRLANTEMALVALLSLIEESLCVSEREAVFTMMEEYFDANQGLGGFKEDTGHGNPFLK